MWINLDIGLGTEEIINYLKSLPKTNAPIYLSLNTIYPANEVFRLLPELLRNYNLLI